MLDFNVKLSVDIEPAITAMRDVMINFNKFTQAIAQHFGEFVTTHAPTRTRSGRWRVQLLKPDGGRRSAVYRTRELALEALRRSLVECSMRD